MKIFLDANVLFSAARSKTGASHQLFLIKDKLKLSFYTSRLAFLEAERNIQDKEELETLLTFYDLVKNIKVIQADSISGKKEYQEIISEKDAPILYGAKIAKVSFLITLDKKHFFTKQLEGAKLPFKIITPGNFLKNCFL